MDSAVVGQWRGTHTEMTSFERATLFFSIFKKNIANFLKIAPFIRHLNITCVRIGRSMPEGIGAAWGWSMRDTGPGSCGAGCAWRWQERAGLETEHAALGPFGDISIDV